jgi:hypothetical protein
MGQWDSSSIHAQAIHKPVTGQAGRGIWMEIGWRQGRPPQLQAPGEPFIVTIVHPQKDVPVGNGFVLVPKLFLGLPRLPL